MHKTSSSYFDHENLQNLSESQSITSNDQNKDKHHVLFQMNIRNQIHPRKFSKKIYYIL